MHIQRAIRDHSYITYAHFQGFWIPLPPFLHKLILCCHFLTPTNAYVIYKWSLRAAGFLLKNWKICVSILRSIGQHSIFSLQGVQKSNLILKLLHQQAGLSQCLKIRGGARNIGWGECASPLVEIGLTDLQKTPIPFATALRFMTHLLISSILETIS